jgi:hypothetical protein
MFLFVLRQLHRLPRMEGNNRAASHKQVHPGQYWKRVLPFLLLLVFLWGVLSASGQLPMSQGLLAATVSSSGLLGKLLLRGRRLWWQPTRKIY